MKKIITAKEQWTNAMNNLHDKDYDCDTCCEDLGAIGENEFYHFYGKGKDLYFYKHEHAYGMYDCTNTTAATLLSNNWTELNPDEDWYNKVHLVDFLIRTAQGVDVSSPILMEDLLWMGIFDATVKETVFLDKEIEVSTEEIEAIRQEIVERCKGHSIEEVRDMFDGYNWGEYGEDTFDFEYKGFVFSIGNEKVGSEDEYSLYLSTSIYSNSGDGFGFVGEPITLPIPPKEIKLDISDIVDEKPDFSFFKSCTNISFDYMVERMRESCINIISDIYQKIGDKYVEIDTKKWLETHGYFAGYCDSYCVADCYCVVLTRNDRGDVVLTGTDTADWDEYMPANNWSFVSLEEMLYIINQLTSK